MPEKKFFISSSTNEMVNTIVDHYVHYYAKEYDVEEALIRAVIKQESNGIFNVLRFECHLEKAGWYVRWLSDEESKDPFAFCSMGLMQVMFGVAKSYGYKGEPLGLLHPCQAIAYGTLHLSKLMKRFNLKDAISAYNQGGPYRHESGSKKGEYKNQDYVDKVTGYYERYKKALKGGCCSCHSPKPEEK